VSLRQAISDTKAYLCLECGICTGSCPVSRYDPDYSPRLTVERALLLGEQETICESGVWNCLTCGTCNLRCPSTVDYTAFVRKVRERARQVGETGVCTHAETLDGITELQLLPTFRRPASWLGRGVKVARRAKDYYFAGCLPFLDIVFRDIGFEGARIGNASVRLLNRIGIVPAVGDGEVCCGHDAYWTGRIDVARDLAERNVEAIRRTGAKKAIFSCPEGYHMFKSVYPDLVGDLGFEPVFILTLLGGYIDALPLRPLRLKVTYQDPCRLVKYDDIIEEPRKILGSIPDLELVEMRRSGIDAVCCGSSNWVNCSRVNKRIQVERLDEARETGAGVLVTACPKCNIHLKCALHDEASANEIEIRDMITLLADSLGGGKRGA
jgi:heterodisulfide reductase subunit D